MNPKDDFIMQICWGLVCLIILNAILMFFTINCFPNFRPHILICSTLIPHDEESTLCILSLKSLCKDGIINNIKYKDVCRSTTKSIYP